MNVLEQVFFMDFLRLKPKIHKVNVPHVAYTLLKALLLTLILIRLLTEFLVPLLRFFFGIWLQFCFSVQELLNLHLKIITHTQSKTFYGGLYDISIYSVHAPEAYFRHKSLCNFTHFWW